MTEAQYIYIAVLLWCCCCLGAGHIKGKVNLWTLITTTKDGREYTDPKKLAYIGTFVVSMVTLAYWGIIGPELTVEYVAYATLCFSVWVGGKYLGDREQRLQRKDEQLSPPP